MNKYSLPFIFIIVLALGVLLGRWLLPIQKPCTHKYINAIEDGRFVIVPTDSAEGRPTYTVIFEDDHTLDHMYAEEIAASLIDQRWHYDESLKIERE